MNEEDIKLLEDNEWEVECHSPFEIRHKDGGAFASGLAAQIVLDSLKQEARTEDWDDVRIKYREQTGASVFATFSFTRWMRENYHQPIPKLK